MEDWKSSKPDFVVYIPKASDRSDRQNQHLLVIRADDGSLLAFWTQGSYESAPDQRVVVSRSTDGGKTFSPPQRIDGPEPGDSAGSGLASWQFPICCPGVLPEGRTRIWIFYVKNIGVSDVREADTGVLRGRYSDDAGLTWTEQTWDYPIEDCAISHPDPEVPNTWIVFQVPTVTRDGAVLAGFTHWASSVYDRFPETGPPNMLHWHSEVRFLRFENILTQPDPDKIEVTTWPKADHGLQVPHPERQGISVAQEPSVQVLSDGRLICVMRTMTGKLWFALSADDGRSWTQPRPLCYEPGGQPLLNPISPAPLYRLGDTEVAPRRYLLLFHNNDGTANGGSGPADALRNRYPAWITVGEEIPGHPIQPIRFGPPQVALRRYPDVPPVKGYDDQDQPAQRLDIGTYTSYLELGGQRILWYPDRKTYLLGKYLSDELIAAASPTQ